MGSDRDEIFLYFLVIFPSTHSVFFWFGWWKYGTWKARDFPIRTLNPYERDSWLSAVDYATLSLFMTLNKDVRMLYIRVWEELKNVTCLKNKKETHFGCIKYIQTHPLTVSLQMDCFIYVIFFNRIFHKNENFSHSKIKGNIYFLFYRSTTLADTAPKHLSDIFHSIQIFFIYIWLLLPTAFSAYIYNFFLFSLSIMDMECNMGILMFISSFAMMVNKNYIHFVFFPFHAYTQSENIIINECCLFLFSLGLFLSCE